MSLWAHVSNSQVLDPQAANSEAHYVNRYTSEIVLAWAVAGHTFKEVPVGVQHNAVDNGDGTYTNPDGSEIRRAA